MLTPIIKNHIIKQQPLVGRILVASFIVLASWLYGWQGFIASITFWVFWLILQFNQTVRMLKVLSERPAGVVSSVPKLANQLRKGMSMLEIVKHSQCLGAATNVPELPPQALMAEQIWQWRDSTGMQIKIYTYRECCLYWEVSQQEDVHST